MLPRAPALGFQSLRRRNAVLQAAYLCPASAAESRDFFFFFFPKKMNCAIIILMDVTRSPRTDT